MQLFLQLLALVFGLGGLLVGLPQQHLLCLNCSLHPVTSGFLLWEGSKRSTEAAVIK